MLARGIEGAVKKQCEILGDSPNSSFSLPAGARVKSLMRSPANDRSAERAGSRIGRHRCEDRALDMAVAAQERVDLAE
jgi:hypothetical protein